MTDDARIVAPKSCQVENEVKSKRDSTQYWIQPSCNFTGNLELALGIGRVIDAQGVRTEELIVQGKTLFRKLETNNWAIGLTAGNVRPVANRAAVGRTGDLYANVPISSSFNDDRLVLHANLGWLYENAARRHRMTWALASEITIADKTALMIEGFGQNQGKPSFQIGLQRAMIPERVELMLIYGNRLGGGSQDRWFSFGLRLLTPAFLP